MYDCRWCDRRFSTEQERFWHNVHDHPFQTIEMGTVHFKIRFEVKGFGRIDPKASLAYLRKQYQTEAIIQACTAVHGGDVGLYKWWVGNFEDGTVVATIDRREYDEVTWVGWFDIETWDDGIEFA